MPRLNNIENNILLEINLLNNSFLDISDTRGDFENWIPFEFILDVEGDIYSYNDNIGATFTVYEIKNLISNFESIIKGKKNSSSVEEFEFYSCEGFFEMIVSDPLEENQVSISIWINIGIMTGGETYGYDKGFRFDIPLSSLISFSDELKQQFEKLTEYMC